MSKISICGQEPSTSTATLNGYKRNIPSPEKPHDNKPQKPLSWKLMLNPIGSDPKERFFRTYGICKEHPEVWSNLFVKTIIMFCYLFSITC